MPRRLLLNSSPPPAAAASPDSKFDANVVMVLSVLLCALICSLGLNSIIRCALRCSHLVPSGDGAVSGAAATARLANTGIKKKALKTFPVITFSAAAGGGLNLDAECVICLSEFAAGDKVKILPKCNHGFHVRCIDKWLGSHSSCPTCRHCLIDTCRKIVAGDTPVPVTEVSGGPSSSSSNGNEMTSTLTPAEGVVITMPPMEAEGPVREHRIVKSVFFWRKV
ncbi:RING-H2 finger protein ATL78 [Linum grandiflorum]